MPIKSHPVISILEVSSSIIDGTTKSGTNCKQTCSKIHYSLSRYQISSQEPVHSAILSNKFRERKPSNSNYLPETRLETRSFPALAVTIVLWAPETQGPWSAHNMIHICPMPYVLVKGQKNTYLLSEQVFFFFF